MALDDVATQLQNITNNLASGALKNETERRLVLAQARNLVAQLESPYDKVLATWSQVGGAFQDILVLMLKQCPER